MLNTLQYSVSVPTAYVFMTRFLKDAQADKKVSPWRAPNIVARIILLI